MLVLSRKAGQKIMIGDGISVIVNRVAGNRVAIGIEAPDGVRILRGELQPQDDGSQDADKLSPGRQSPGRSVSTVSAPVVEDFSAASQ